MTYLKKFLKFAPVALVLAFMGQACPIQFGSSNSADGGIFRSSDAGANWVTKNAILSVSGGRSLSQVDVLSLVADPQEPSTIYVGTPTNGLFYTTDGGDSWFAPPQLSTAKINAIAVHPKNKCVVYAVSINAVVKTVDCTRTWTKVFEDTRGEVTVNAIGIDSFNPSIVYLGTSKGDIIKSTDDGTSWGTVKVLSSPVVALPIDPNDSRVLYAATRSSGVWKSVDAGAEWSDVSDGMNDREGAKEIWGLYADRSKKDSYVAVSSFGLMRTTDGGSHWDPIRLLTPAGQARIYGFAMNPGNGLEMYYATATIFYKSTDGGAHWTTKRLPTSRAGNALLVDGKNQNLIYLGTLKLKK